MRPRTAFSVTSINASIGLAGEPWVEVIVTGVSGLDEARALVAEVAAEADPDWHRYFRFGEA